MNAAKLFEHFERVAEAPDAITRLRRFILDLAVRGKLVEQDPNDEAASDLMKRVAVEQGRLEEAGTIRKREQLRSVDPQEAPYRLPTGWQWVRFAQLANFYAGRTPARNDLSFWNTGEHAWVSIADMEDGGVVSHTKETVSTAALNQVFKSEPEPVGTIIMSFKLTIGKIARLGVPAFHNEAIISIHPYLQALEGYLFMALPELARAGNTKGAIKGATLNRESLSNILVPLPPLAEQLRIVARVDELMALCDQLETAEAERETGRHKLMLSTLAKLNEPDSETFAGDARFALDNLKLLTKRTDQISQIRQTILNLAVRGKLAEQNPNDEPAVEMLRRIDITKQKMTGIGKQKMGADVAPSDPVPFRIPINWTWCGATHPTRTISDVGRKIQTSEVLASGKYPVVDQGKVFIRGYCNDDDKLIKIGKPVIVFGDHTRETKLIDFDFIVGADGVKILEPIEISPQFYHLCLKWLPLNSRGYGRHFKLLRQSYIPLPPLAEQHRIVAKVDELMALCDQLKASLVEGEQTRSKLLEAVLHQALEPA